jgi:cytochrome c peroxidase
VLCHAGPNFSAASVFEPPLSGLRIFPVFASEKYARRYNLTKDVGANTPGSAQAIWRVPSLRNVALTAPYFHNGSVDNLPEAVRIMATMQRGKRISNDLNDNKTIVWSNREKTLARLEAAPLSDGDVNDIVEFLKALSSDKLSARSKGAVRGM